MSQAAVLRYAFIVTLAAVWLPSAFADPASSSQSAWRRSPPKIDPSLRDPLVKRGKEVFEARCQVCHGVYSKNPAQGSSIYASPEMPGTVALEMRYKGQRPALLEERTDLTPEVVAVFVRRGGGGAMPAFRPTEVSNDDLKALGAYLARKRKR
jgi:(+)-pinoresinol hydroxylase